MITQENSERLKKVSKNTVIIGALILLFGLLALIYPTGFGKFTTVVIGMMVVSMGILRFIFAAASSTVGSMILRYILAGFITLTGLWMVFNAEMGLAALTLIMAIYFIVDGVMGIVYGLQLRKIGRGKYLIFSSVMSLILGVLVYAQWPESSRYAIGILLGVKFLFDGFGLTTMGYFLRKSVDLNQGGPTAE